MGLYLLYRGIRDRAYFVRLPERLGFLPRSFQSTGSTTVWFHAVSVGEVLSAVELIRRLREEQPGISVFLSTTTLAGRAAAEQRLKHGVFYLPLDYRSMVRRVLRRLRPSAIVILETEIWPNLYREAKRAGASLMIVNGRISDRSLPSYRRASGFFRHALIWPDAIFTQSEEDARRFIIAGAPQKSVSAAGNLKYDVNPPASGIAPDLAGLIDRLNPQAIWMAASTTAPKLRSDPDEDDAVIEAFLELNRPEVLLILAPRHPARFDAVAEKLKRSGFAFARRTALKDAPEHIYILLLDSIGELAGLFERATVVFMGGTLSSRGGHNILEPAYFSKPVIAGPHMENFADIAREFTANDALLRIRGANELASAVASLLDDPSRAAMLGANAQELAMAKRGVTGNIVAEVLKQAALGVPNPPRTLAARLALTPLSWAWRAGHRISHHGADTPRHINLSRPSNSLSTKVISVGALSMGGAGKTPVVAYLAERLAAAGKAPAILTRGYRRKSKEPVIIPRGEKAARELTGDEAQIFIRAGHAHVGVAADRHSVGMEMERQFHPDVFLLDDGFQHFRLKRDLDIVLIDALDPLGGVVFPLGRLREPFENIARAGVILITRVEPQQGTTGIEKLIRRYNTSAPIHRCRTLPREWVHCAGPELSQPFRRVGAFCALGSPNAFWRTLDQLGLELAFRRAFRDHHPYSPPELIRLAAEASAQGVDALVTTEKDAINLPGGGAALLHNCPLYWLKIGIEIERDEELMRLIL